MKKDKEWLARKVRNLPSDSEIGYSKVRIADALLLIEQLDEPDLDVPDDIDLEPYSYRKGYQAGEEAKKVIVPYFIDEFIKDARNKIGDIATAMWEMYEYEYPKVFDWVLEDGNDEILMKAFANDYEVEKETLYKVSSNDNSSGFWFLTKDNDGKVVIGTNEDYFNSEWESIKLTEKEIKDYDPRYWAFAVEVSE